MHRSRLAAAAAAIVVALALAGCTATPPTHRTTPTPTASAGSALSALAPDYPSKLTAADAKTITVQNADAIQALVATSEVSAVDNNAKLVAATKTTAAYYGVARAMATVKGFDAIAQAEAMEKLLVLSGWKKRESKTTTARYSAVLTRDTVAGESVLGLQASAATKTNPPVVLFTLESPDLPK